MVGSTMGAVGGTLDFKRAEVSSSHRTYLRCTHGTTESMRDVVGQWDAGKSEAARRCCALCTNANASVNSGPGPEASVV